jgi:hypothetical protein
MTKTSAAHITEGDNVAVRLTVAAGHCAIGTQSIYGNVSRETVKAVEITTFSDQRRVWLPRRALVKGTERGGCKAFAVARWFRPDERHWSAATTSTLAA